jgi:hypothetical protein
MNSSQLDRPISLPFLPQDRLTPERFLAAVERVVQSNDQFTLDDSLNVNVVHVEMPQGAGNGKRRDVVNLKAYLNKKGCIVQIKNNDDLCCARAIVQSIGILWTTVERSKVTWPMNFMNLPVFLWGHVLSQRLKSSKWSSLDTSSILCPKNI